MDISRRDYFAAHAPEKPTWDFQPDMPTPRPQPMWPNGRPEGEDEEPINGRELASWDAAYERAIAVQWPWAWAAALMEAEAFPAKS